MTEKNPDEHVVFAVNNEPGELGLTVVVGVPHLAWEKMQDGNAQNFDLIQFGIPLRFFVFGVKDHATAMEMLKPFIGENPQDVRDVDCGVKMPSSN